MSLSKEVFFFFFITSCDNRSVLPSTSLGHGPQLRESGERGWGLSGGVFEFRRLWVTWLAAKRREAGGGRGALALHENRVQARDFGGEESVNTMKHGIEVGELQLLKETEVKHVLELWCFVSSTGSVHVPWKWLYLRFNRFGVWILE